MTGDVIGAGRARDELQAAGARPRRPAVRGPDALTAAEHRVAQFAADGRSNRKIAEHLHVTQRTVETHLTHAFQKLDIHARAELRVALAGDDGGALPPQPEARSGPAQRSRRPKARVASARTSATHTAAQPR